MLSYKPYSKPRSILSIVLSVIHFLIENYFVAAISKPSTCNCQKRIQIIILTSYPAHFISFCIPRKNLSCFYIEVFFGNTFYFEDIESIMEEFVKLKYKGI